MDTIAYTGASGQLGRALGEVFPNGFGLTRKDFDFVKDSPQKITKVLKKIKSNYLIHLGAYTKVDACEKEVGLAYESNSFGTLKIALACREVGCKLIYISSDYVFDGNKKEPYTEYDEPYPLSVYGKSKLLGEMFVEKVMPHRMWYIIRTSWIFGPSLKSKNFVDTILKLSETKEELRIINDQIGSPTYTLHLAEGIKELLSVHAHPGIYHITNSGTASWYKFAKRILYYSGVRINTKVIPISTKEYPTLAKRPSYSVLSNERYKLFCSPLPSWSTGLRQYLKEVRR